MNGVPKAAAPQAPDAPARTRRAALVRAGLGLAVSVVFAVVFVRLFDFITDSGHATLPFDRDLLVWMFRHRTLALDRLAVLLAHMGSPPVIVGVAAGGALVGLVWRKVRGAAWTLPIAALGAGVIIQSVKMIVRRPRPLAVPHGFRPLIHETGFSFPSGHSVIAVVVYGLLGFFALRLVQNRAGRVLVRLATVLIVLAIGASRVYVGVHYPTDVLAGWSAGVPWLVTCLGLHELLVRRWPSSGEPVLTPQDGGADGPRSARASARTLFKG